MKRKLSVFIIFTYLIISVFAAESTVTEKKNTPTKYAKDNITIGTSYKDLIRIKGKPSEENYEGTNVKNITNVIFREKWFDIIEKVKTDYVISDNEVVQIRIVIPRGIDKIELIGKMTKKLGKSEQGKYNIFSPVKYFSSWMKNGINYVLQDYGTYMEIIIARAYFYDSSNKYGLDKNCVIINRLKGNFIDMEYESEVFVLGSFLENSQSEMNNIKILVPEKSENDPWKKVEFPEELTGQAFNVNAEDFNNDEIKEIFIAYKTKEDSDENFVVYSMKEEVPKLVFSSADLAEKKTKGSFENGYILKLKSDISGKEYKIDLKGKKKLYQKEKIYLNDKIVKPMNISAVRVNGYSLEDVDGDGIKELRIKVLIKGINMTDDAAWLTIYYKYSGDGFLFLKEDMVPVK